MKHDYTNDEIRDAWNHRNYLPGQRGKTLDNLRAFLAALPERPQAAEIAALKEELAEAIKERDRIAERVAVLQERNVDLENQRDQARQQADAEMVKRRNFFQAAQNAEAEADQLRAEVEELRSQRDQLNDAVAELNQRLIERTQDMLSKHTELIQEARQAKREARDAKAELAALRQSTQSAQTILADDGRSLGQVAFDAGNIVQKIKFPEQEIETWGESAEVHDMLEAAAQAVAAVVLAQAVRRMEAVPWRELKYVDYEAVRARLIAAAKGEGQAKAKNIPGDKCPACGAKEVESNTPNTTYACGSSDYDGRPGTFHPGDQCNGQAQEVPQAEAKPDPAQAQQEPAQPWTPAVGDTVRLKSGGPVMTVNEFDPETYECECVAMIEGRILRFLVSAACLTPAKP